MQITLSQFEQIDGIRSAMLRLGSYGRFDGFNTHSEDPRVNEARYESRLFDALVNTFGFAAINDVPDVGTYADELITGCLIGSVSVVDEEA